MEKNIISKVENKVKDTIEKYELLDKKERIIVASSGGKDSQSILHILKKQGYNVSALYINLRLGNYSERCQKAVLDLCEKEEIKMQVLDINSEFGMRMCNIRCGVQEKNKVSNCMVCGIVKKWLLNKYARNLRAKKIVTGHHLDDEAQTVLMNFLQGNLMLAANAGPLTGIVKDKKFVPRIKPLYFVSEEEIRKYCERKKLPFVNEKCPCSAGSLRIRTREFAKTLRIREKERIVSNFLEILPTLRDRQKKEKIIYCKNCGEPARNELCKKCEMLQITGK